MRRVDSLDLARLRLPESCARSKSRKSKLGGDKKDSEMRSSRTSVSAGECRTQSLTNFTHSRCEDTW